MKKIAITILVSSSIILALNVRLYHLQNGYYIQGINGYGYLTKYIFKPIITDPILGIQGTKNGYIYGWINSKSNESKYFLINSRKDKINWYPTFENLVNECEQLALPLPDMNKETNFISMRSGTKKFKEY